MQHSKLCPGVDLVEISKEVGAASEKVVRWCPRCGAVVVDEDYEGRVIPGRVMKMRFPKLAGRLVAEKLASFEIVPSSLSPKDQETLLEDVGRRTREQ